MNNRRRSNDKNKIAKHSFTGLSYVAIFSLFAIALGSMFVGYKFLMPSGNPGFASLASADQNIRNVGDFLSIQDAINDLPSEGGTVQIPAGIYIITEPIVLKSNQKLYGEGDSTVIKAADNFNGSYMITSYGGSNITLRDFELDGNRIARNDEEGHGIYFGYDHSNINIENLTIINTRKTGIYFFGSVIDSEINKCRIIGTGGIGISGAHGIALGRDTSNVILSENCLQKIGENSIASFGIVCSGNGHSILGNSIIDYQSCGIYSEVGNGIAITNNLIKDGNSGSRLFMNCLKINNCEISGNNCVNGGGIEISSGHNVVFNGNYVENNMSIGHSCFELNNDENMGSSNNTITNNTFINSMADCMWVQSADTVIANNTVCNSYGTGIYVTCGTVYPIASQGLVIRENTVISNGKAKASNADDGIAIDNTRNATITGNVCTDDQESKTQDCGIRVGGTSDYITITNNILEGNKSLGLAIVGTNNLIRDNTGSSITMQGVGDRTNVSLEDEQLINNNSSSGSSGGSSGSSGGSSGSSGGSSGSSGGSSGSSEGIIAGKILNSSGQIIPNATITIGDINITYDIRDGHFVAGKIPSGVHPVLYNAPGYYGQVQMIEIKPEKTTQCLTCLLSPINASATISGRIFDNRRLRPISGSTARIDNTILQTNSAGNFMFTGVVPGQYRIYYTAPYYETQEQLINVAPNANVTCPAVFLSR